MAALVSCGLSLCALSCTHTSTGRLDDDAPAASAAEALSRLKAGNQRFAASQIEHPHMSAAWRNRLVSAQHPIAVIVGCSDSRVPTELVFDQGFGDLFVIRNAGHVMTTAVLGSIEYALLHLHVHLVVIMGHEGCGAVTAALDAKDREKEPIELQEVLHLIDPALRDVSRTGAPEKRIAAAVEANVRYSQRQLVELVDERGKAAELDSRIVGAVYSLKTGTVSFLE